MVNFAPMSNALLDDDPVNPTALASANFARLAAWYNEAKLSNKNGQIFAIYQEFERRCAGANCHQLAKEYPAVYESKLNEYAHKSVSELKQIYSNVQQQVNIRTNYDATHISDVPKELLIDSAALLTTIKRKEI